MDARLVIVGIIFVVLLVAFGNNPMEKKASGKDPFQESLETTLDKNNQALTAEQMGGGGAGVMLMQNGTGGNGGYIHPIMPAGPVQGGGMRMPGVPGVVPPSNNVPTGPSMALKPGYQRSPTSAAVNQQQPSQPATPQAPSFYLKDGRQVFFSGYQVFTMGSDGNLNPLSDGSYVLKSGDPVVIRDGQRVAE